MKKKKDNKIIFFLIAGALLWFAFKPKKKPVQQILKEAFNNLDFEFNKAIIKDSSFNSLNELSEVLNQTNWNLILSGHTDNVGSEEFNLKLSTKRAEAVKDYLINKGIAAERITAKGFGETMPIAPNDTEQNRALNRRVEFFIVKPK
jgi:OOP family OmpA-OmpF porin